MQNTIFKSNDITNASISIFNFQDLPVRIFLQDSDVNQVYFCLRDVCDVLELENTSRVLSYLDQDGITTSNVISSYGNNGANQRKEMTFINEKNLYRVIFKSRKPEAEAFQNFVFDEVLPTIRKTGSFDIKQSSLKNKTVIHQKKPLDLPIIADNLEAGIKIASLLGLSGNSAILSADAMLKRKTGVSPMELMQVKHLTNDTQELDFNVKDIGSRLNLSAIKINNILIDMDFQTRLADNSSGCNYKPTKLGEPFAVLKDTQKSFGGRNILQLMWKESVIPAIQNFISLQGLCA